MQRVIRHANKLNKRLPKTLYTGVPRACVRAFATEPAPTVVVPPQSSSTTPVQQIPSQSIDSVIKQYRRKNWTKNGWIALLALLLLVSASTNDEDKQQLLRLFSQSDKLEDEISQLIVEKCIQDGIIGGTFCMTINDQLTFHKSFGYSDLENSTPMNTAHKMRIASVSKSMTAIALGLLVQDGLLDWDTPAYQYLPDDERFKGLDQRITIRMLAGHLSGVRAYAGAEQTSPEFLSTTEYTNSMDPVHVFINDDLKHEPGTKYLYSTFGYTILGALIEHTVQKQNPNETYLSFMQHRVFDELNMEDTSADVYQDIIKNRARAYRRTNNQLYNAPHVHLSNKWAGGGFMSTALDLCKFGNGVLSNKLLSKTITEELFKAQELKIVSKVVVDQPAIVQVEPSSETAPVETLNALNNVDPTEVAVSGLETVVVGTQSDTDNGDQTSLSDQIIPIVPEQDTTLENLQTEEVVTTEEQIQQPETSEQQVTSPVSTPVQTTGYGIGFFVDSISVPGRKNKLQIVGHTGGSVGGSSVLVMVPEERIVLSMIVNTESIKLRPLAEQIARKTIQDLDKDRVYL